MSNRPRKVHSPQFIVHSILFFSILSTAYYLLPTVSYAAPCHGTKMPQRNKFFANFESYSIFKRYLEDSRGKLRSQQQFYGLSIGVFDWLSIDLKAGAGNIKQHPVGGDEVDYPTSFSGGYGLRLKFFDKSNVKAVLGFQHISTHPKTIHLGDAKDKAILDDWQWSILASYNLKRITPYSGVRWSRVDYIHWVLDQRKRHMSDRTRSIGLICGFDIPLTKKIWVNLEGSAFDSEALAFSFNYSF